MSAPSTSAQGSAAAKYDRVLQQFALGFPEAIEEAPWGHRALKVRGKTFLFLVADSEGLSLSVKLPESGPQALMAPFSEPTGYGLGKSGWVTARFGSNETPPLDDLRQWIRESYRAMAPKRLVKQLDAPAVAEPARAKARQNALPGARPKQAARKRAGTRAKASPKRKA